MHVTADMFSGRPNPVWELDASEAAEVAALLRGLPSSRDATTLEAEGLGYRGFVVTGAAEALGGCEEVRVKHGQVLARCAGARRGFADPERRLERRLVESARRHLDAELAATVSQVAGM